MTLGHNPIETYLAVKHMHFRRYKFNVYVLHKSALIIQHWFFKTVSKLQDNHI